MIIAFHRLHDKLNVYEASHGVSNFKIITFHSCMYVWNCTLKFFSVFWNLIKVLRCECFSRTSMMNVVCVSHSNSLLSLFKNNLKKKRSIYGFLNKIIETLWKINCNYFTFKSSANILMLKNSNGYLMMNNPRYLPSNIKSVNAVYQ